MTYLRKPAMIPKQPLRRSDIRASNELLVLKLIRDGTGISQSQVARRTGLKPPTVYRIFSSLEDAGYVMPVGKTRPGAGGRGRKPLDYVVNPSAGFVIGVDFWSKMISVVVVDFAGEPVYDTLVMVESPEASRVVRQIVDTVGSVLDATEIASDKVLGVGIGCPGKVDLENGRVIRYGRIRDMTDFGVQAYMESELGMPVVVHNNSSVIARSMYRRGLGKSFSSLMVILVRSGVGGAFIRDGEIFVNHEKTSLEIGHMSVDIDGPICGCGAKGCLETFISEDALRGASSDYATFEEFSRAVRNGDTLARNRVEEKGAALASAIRSLVQLFSPDAVAIVSRSRIVSEILAASTRDTLSALSFLKENGVTILHDEFDATIASRGAADIVFDTFFAIG